jgi:VWFA-related protein
VYRTLTALLAIAVVITAATGHSSGQQKPPQFVAGTDLIRVDVSVLDRNRRPVHGLTMADFSLREDGRDQPIVAFSEVTLPDPETFPAAWMREAAHDIRRNDDVSDHRLIVVVMDDAMITSLRPQWVNSARDIARGVIERLGARDLAAVLFTKDQRRSQNFTADRARLLAAVDSFTGGAGDPLDLFRPNPLPIIEAARGFDSLATLRHLVSVLETLHDRRKAIVYVSLGVPARPESRDPNDPKHELYQELKDTLRRAERAHVNIYAVDPGGLDGLRFYLESPTLTSRHELEREMGRTISEELSRTYRESLQVLAENTGGRAAVSINEFGGSVEQIFRETGSFYLLGYRSDNPKTDGKYRRIQVRVNRSGLTVNARRGYFAPEPSPIEAKAPPPATLAAIAGLLPKKDLPLVAAASAMAVDGSENVPIAVMLGLPAPPAFASGKDTVDLLMTAFNEHGDRVLTQESKAEITLARPMAARRSDGWDVAYEVLARLDLRPGRYELRLSASSAAHGTSGSVYYDVDVPDIRRSPLSLSGLVLSAEPALEAGPRDLFRALSPGAPTVRRTFATADRVHGFVRAHQGGTAPPTDVSIAVRVLNATDRVVFDVPRQVGSNQFTPARSFDYPFEVPVARLEPGEYLLRVDAVAGKATARRDARFTVR